jgi:hypothetical protein
MLHAPTAERNLGRRIRGAADQGDTAGYVVRSRGRELQVEATRLPGCKGQWKGKSPHSERRSTDSSLRYRQTSVTRVAESDGLRAAGSHFHVAEAYVIRAG